MTNINRDAWVTKIGNGEQAVSAHMGRECLSLCGPHNVSLLAAVLSQHGHVMFSGGQVVTCSVVVENYLIELCLVLLDVLQVTAATATIRCTCVTRVVHRQKWLTSSNTVGNKIRFTSEEGLL